MKKLLMAVLVGIAFIALVSCQLAQKTEQTMDADGLRLKRVGNNALELPPSAELSLAKTAYTKLYKDIDDIKTNADTNDNPLVSLANNLRIGIASGKVTYNIIKGPIHVFTPSSKTAKSNFKVSLTEPLRAYWGAPAPPATLSIFVDGNNFVFSPGDDQAIADGFQAFHKLTEYICGLKYAASAAEEKKEFERKILKIENLNKSLEIYLKQEPEP